jgi:hypothetical protein
MISLLKKLFEEKFVVDNRTPTFAFELKGYEIYALPPMPILILQVIAVRTRRYQLTRCHI